MSATYFDRAGVRLELRDDAYLIKVRNQFSEETASTDLSPEEMRALATALLKAADEATPRTVGKKRTLADSLRSLATDAVPRLHNDAPYRRGYVHGYSAGVDDMQTHPLKWVLHFFNTALMAWRCRDPMTDQLRPPMISESKAPE